MSEIFAPLLFGLLFVTALNLALVYWQQERTGRVLYLCLTFACLCLLYLASALIWPAIVRDSIRVALLFILVVYQWYSWPVLWAFLQRKDDDAHTDAVAPISTLAELGEAQATTEDAAALEATSKDKKS